MTTERDLEIMQGDQIRLQFTLSVRGVGPWDVSGASGIVLSLADDSGGALSPVAALSADTTADWVGGKVPVLLPSSVTAEVQVLSYALTITIGGEVVTPIRGRFFVEKTPGFVPAP